MKTTLKKDTPLLTGSGHAVVLTKDTEVDFPNVVSIDALAEVMATARFDLSGLTHDEDVDEIVEGKPTGKKVKVTVSYGVAGQRVEEDPAEVKKRSAAQAAAVTAADKAAKEDVKQTA